MRQKIKKRWLAIVALAMMALVGGALFWPSNPVEAAHTHSYRWVVKKNATCTSEGYKNYECSCGACSGSQTIPKTPHNFNVNAATCTTAKKCRTCGYVAQGATGHSWNRGSATCTASKSCTKCGAVAEAAKGHNYGWVEVISPTCASEGRRDYRCSTCGNVANSQSIAKVPNHNMVFSHRVTGDCTHDSYDVYKCSRCGWSANYNVTKCKGHNYSWVEVVKPTCTKTGRRDYRCTTCGYVSDSQTLEKVPSHTMKVVKKEATVREDGYEKKYCAECGYVEYNNVIPKLAITVIYDTAGGQFPNGTAKFTKSVTYDKTYGKVDIPARSGYTFLGWYTGTTGGSAVSETTVVKTAKNHMIYAHWLKNTAISSNASDNTFSFVVDDFGGEDWAYYFVEFEGSTSRCAEPSWVGTVKCTKSTRTISFNSDSISETPKNAYIYTYSKKSGKAVTYTIKTPNFCTVTVDVKGKKQYYYVPKGQTFTFPAEPEVQDGEAFNGWELNSATALYKPGDTITVNSNRKVNANIFVMYRKIGAVYNVVDHQMYNIWMVTNGYLTDCEKNHKDNDLLIDDNPNSGHGRNYQIRDSWRFDDETFQKEVCELIIKYNKDMGRTSEWDRTLSGCMLEWAEHNMVYNLCAPFSFAQNYAEKCRHVDIDAEGYHCYPSDAEMKEWIENSNK